MVENLNLGLQNLNQGLHIASTGKGHAAPNNFLPFKTLPGLSLRGTSTECPPATMNVVSGNFQREIEEK